MAVSHMSIPSTAPRIVAIGASAGGITALQKLFETLPLDAPFAIVVLQHLPPTHSSVLSTLISRWTAIPVHTATDGSRPDTNCIYIPSPEHILTLEGGIFRTRAAKGGSRRPGIDSIDAFLESLALYIGPRPIAVILSGSGMDGTAGAVRIRQAGGIVIVQDPLTALQDGMPNAVIQRGIHDHLLPVSAIGLQLLACLEPEYVRPAPSSDWSGDMSGTLDRILSLIQKQSGFDLSGYKPSPLLWRIQQRMDVRRVWTFEDYALLVEDDPIEIEALCRELPIHVTEFFRDPEAWVALKDELLPQLLSAAKEQQSVRAWTAACSTGEEAYSVAMLLYEASQANNAPAAFQVFATDAAPEILTRASRGIYRDESLSTVSPARRAAYFYAADRNFRVKRFLRERMVFAPQNLIADPPFSGLDLVTCRNLLIYLEPATADYVLSALNAALKVGGYLFLGSSEAYQLSEHGFEAVSRKWNIFRKISPRSGGSWASLPTKPTPSHATLSASEHRAALAQFDLPSVLIDESGCILRIYGDTEGILSLPAGEPTQNLFALLRKSWSGRLRAAVRQIFADHEPMILTDLNGRDAAEEAMNVRLTPLQGSKGVWNKALVSFIKGSDEPAGSEFRFDDEYYRATSKQCREDEARISREELDASREELQALNEELRASNSQLNTSNAELYEANFQLHEKVAQLKMQSGVLSSGEVMTLFVDHDLKIRWFTPAMHAVFQLTPDDTGRNIADLVPKFHDPKFYSDIHDVLHAIDTREAAVYSDHDKCFARRMYPYTSETGDIVGVAITFSDITDRRLAELQLRRSQSWLTAQKEAFQAAMDGAALETSLGILIRTLVSQARNDRRCAFYIAEGSTLRHVVGMSDSYAECVNGFPISGESLACGLAVATGEPVITRDVLDEPRWQPWTWLAKRFGYRGCWSFPVETPHGHLVGSLAMYFAEPREPTAVDLELAASFTQTAAIIISKYRHSKL